MLADRIGYEIVDDKKDFFVAKSYHSGHLVTIHMDQLRKPRRHSPAELLQAGVLLDITPYGPVTVTMTCMICGEWWHPSIRRGGYFYRNAWKCFHGCHDHLE